MALVIDTGVLLAALDRKDASHAACSELLAETSEDRIVPGPVLVELDYLLRKQASVAAWLSFCEDVAAGLYAIFWPDAAQLVATARLQARYSSLGLGFVDAAVFTTCSALDELKLATLDRRDFTVLRTEDGKPLTIYP